MTDHHQDEFERLIERSSLGAAIARQLRSRTPPESIERVRRIGLLREHMANSDANEAA